jgi:uncharacterized delta-60 repeat protein
MPSHYRRATFLPRAISLAIASGLAGLAHAPASLAAAGGPGAVVGITIGSDLVVDTRFGDAGYITVDYNDKEGIQDETVRVLAAADGGSWLVGYHRTAEFADRLAIARFDADGRIDPDYGTGGRTLSPTEVSYIRDAILVGDRFYFAGLHLLTSFGPSVFAIGCAGLDGTPCAGFGDGGTVTIAVNEPGRSSDVARILHRDGKLYAIGNTDPGGPLGFSSAIAVARLDAATGALDAGFGDGSGPLPGTSVFDPELVPGGFDFAYAAAFAADGKLLVGGGAQDNRNSGSDAYVLAIDPDTGALDTRFGTGGYAWFSTSDGVNSDRLDVRALHVFEDGRILLAGNGNYDDEFFNSITNVLLASLDPDGTPSAGFGVGGMIRTNVGLNTEVQDMVVRPNGDIVVGMASSGLLPNPYTPAIQQSIVQFDAAGNGPTATVSIEYPVGGDFPAQGRPSSLLVDSRDRVLVAGFSLWEFVWPIPDAYHTLTRLVRDGVFASGFEAE